MRPGFSCRFPRFATAADVGRLLLLLLLVARAWVPVGYMPDADALRQGRLALGFCSAGGGTLAALQALTPNDLVLPIKGFANRITGRTMGDHMEETAKIWEISREAQDAWSLKSHQRAVAGWENGFFDDLVIPLPEITRDANPRADTSAEKLATLPVAFDKTSGKGTLTAGNSSPITDGAAACWVATETGLKKLPFG